MINTSHWLAGLVLIACLTFCGCRQMQEEAETTVENEAAKVTHLEGPEHAAEPTQIKLTEDAAKRLDIQTEAVIDESVAGKTQHVIPYAAVLYDTEGKTWTYTNPEPLVFMRHLIVVDRIDGDKVALSDSPPVGTKVVTVGASELYGSEFEFEEE
jgi:hypothetical protein